ncbi:MAG: ABC transporter permease [Burkholderiales bacterium]|nr:ABC transporter permease [Burkholderiales bacterium]MDE2394276.1 ABC transporter permease [Burkholderiales bacterium]MDE2451964.1 ABC transporter permease [Burkholderiales bacterium]
MSELAPASTRGQARMDALRRAAYRLRQSGLSLVGLVLVVMLLVVAAAGPWMAPYADQLSGAIDAAGRLQPPSAAHWMGTNELGQDVFTLVLGGARISLFAGLAVVLLGAAVGTVVGAIAGYLGGWTDEVLMRFTDLALTLPGLILAMAVAAALGAGTGNMVLAIAITWWPGYARLVRGEVLARREDVYVLAARALGARPGRIMARHILPNIVSPVIVKMSLDVGFAVLTVASLGFVGIGVRPPTPEWGQMLSSARGYLPDYWWTAIFPGAAIFVAVLGFNLLGDGLRDVLDPRSRR